MQTDKKLFLITGHPRSGTTYTRTLLEAAGLKVGGEHWGRPGYAEGRPPVAGIVSWFHAVLLPDEIGPVVHQVRHPLDVIPSAQTLTNGAFRLMFQHTSAPKQWYPMLRLRRLFKGITTRNALHWAMHTWLHWNEMLDSDDRVVLRYRVEEIEHNWSAIMDAIGIEAPPFPRDVPHNVNTRKSQYADKRMDPELTNRIVAKAKEYGYEISD